MKDRLIELLKKTPHGTYTLENVIEPLYIENVMAKYLLENGVIVPPCKVGDVVYLIMDAETVHRRILETEVIEISMNNRKQVHLMTTKKYRYNFTMVPFEDFGKTVFLTREEAVAKLKEGGQG